MSCRKLLELYVLPGSHSTVWGSKLPFSQSSQINFKVDTSMDTNTGDWTLDSSRTRLHEYFQQRGIEVEYAMQEIGFPPDRIYTACLDFEIDGKR